MPKAVIKFLHKPPLGFPRTYRLTSKADFQSVFAKPLKISRKSLLILYRPNQFKHPRLGIVIAKHHIKLAADRNRIRRMVRESFRYHQEELGAFDIVVLIRSRVGMETKVKPAWRRELDLIWRYLQQPEEAKS